MTHRVFFAAPLNPDYQWVRNAAAAACREMKMDFRSIDEKAMPGQDILRAMRSEIAQCSLAIVVISGFNPNVMYELGLLHCRSKPTVILVDAETVKVLPF